MSCNMIFSAVSVVVIILAATTNANTDVALGECSEYAIKAGTAVSFNGQLTTVYTGDVGVAPGDSIGGSFIIDDGTEESNSPSANQCSADLKSAYNTLVAAPCPASNSYAELGGLTLFPGVYCSGSEMKFSASTLTLDGQGDPNAQWIFQVGTALTTATTTSFILENGAKAENVFWAVGSSVAIGYSSSFVGNILANTKIFFGSSSVITGRALTFTAVSFESGSSVSLPTSNRRSLVQFATADVPLALGSCATFAILGGTSVNFNGVKTVVKTGSVGVSPGSNIGGSYEIDAGTEEHNTPLAKSCAANLAVLYNQASTAQCSANHTLQTSDLAGVVLTPGVYCSATGKFTLSAATVTLDAQGNPGAQWVFQTVTTLDTSTATSFKLINGAQAANVFWAIGTSASIGYSSSFVGTIFAQEAVNYGSSSVIVGRGLAMTAVTFASGGYISLPTTN
jgi:Ice-binding-like